MIIETTGNLLTTDAAILVHQTNCYGVMGAGIAKQIRAQYPSVYNEYKQLCSTTKPENLLGHAQMCPVGHERFICNLFGQQYYGRDTKQYTDYKAFDNALHELLLFMVDHHITSVAFPKHIGCGLAGGDWHMIYSLIRKYFHNHSWITCTIVDYAK